MADYTTKEVLTMIRGYNRDVDLLNKLLAERDSDDMRQSVGVAQYGNTTMTFSNSFNSPTEKQALKIMADNGVIGNCKKHISFIDERSKRIYKPKHKIAFSLCINGYETMEIAEKLRIGRTGVQNILNEIAQLMAKDENEYILYCKRKKIDPII